MKQSFLSPGHNACSGCGQLSAAQAVMRALDKDTIIVNATGCLEVTTTAYPHSSWGLPWIHSLFENSSAVASGVRAALNSKKNKKTKVLVQAGDGGTFDIGLGLISGMWTRKEDIVYICYDTESYSNTGVQASGATPYGANTTTSPKGALSIGSDQNKKDMLAIALGHGLNYVAQSVAGFPDDITNKVKRALDTPGPSYIQILSPCMPGWGVGYHEAAKLGKLAVRTALYPLLEYENGKLVKSSITENFSPLPAVDYIKAQARFRHLQKNELDIIQKISDNNISKYKL